MHAATICRIVSQHLTKHNQWLMMEELKKERA